jgi:nucleoside-diphosphate-sugar epimerase
MSETAFPWRGRRVLMTGYTGFLGAAVARELTARGAEVVALVRASLKPTGPVHLVHGRPENVFRLHSAMAIHEVATVFHLAAHDPFGDDRATPAVLEAAKLYARRVPVVAARPIPALGIARADARPDGLTVARFGELFGPGDRKVLRAVPAAARALVGGSGPVFADGAPRDFVHVADAARACVLAAEAAAVGGPAEYTFRSGWLLTDRQIATAVRDVAAARPVAPPDAAPHTNPLGWEPARPFAEALGETVTWYRATAADEAARAA